VIEKFSAVLIEGDFNQRHLLYKIAQIIALSTVYHLLQCLGWIWDV